MVQTGRAGALIAAVAWLFIASPAGAQSCRVLDPQLQGSYAGPCVDGLAEGKGVATGIARYEGEFKAGQKHGRGLKTWANGDHYEGEFADDRMQGQGTYTWGEGPWQGERYEGSYVADKREGFGVYRWRNGNVYIGPWKGDAYTGQLVARDAAELGAKVCKELQLGGGQRRWVRGVLEARQDPFVGVRVEDPGLSKGAGTGDHRWEPASNWQPCS
jgi:hypothetical protein